MVVRRPVDTTRFTRSYLVFQASFEGLGGAPEVFPLEPRIAQAVACLFFLRGAFSSTRPLQMWAGLNHTRNRAIAL